VLTIDFVSLAFQTSTENEHDTQTKNRDKITLSHMHDAIVAVNTAARRLINLLKWR